MPDGKIVAVALLTRRDLEAFGSCLDRVFPVGEGDAFETLLDKLETVPAVPIAAVGNGSLPPR